MFYSIIIPVIFCISVISCSYFEGDNESSKTKLDHTGILNKGIWINNSPKEDLYEKTTGDFIFRPNSLDVDNQLQNNFDAFAESVMQSGPILSGYVERNKRSSDFERKSLLNNNLSCNGDKKCTQMKKQNDKSSLIKSKMISVLKPASVFNDYPYEVAVMLGDNKADTPKTIRKIKEIEDPSKLVIALNESKNQLQDKADPSTDSQVRNSIKYNNTNNTSSTPKRSMKNDYETEIIKKIEYTEEIDKFNESINKSKVDRNVFANQERDWYQNSSPLNIRHEASSYNVEPHKNKPVNERGLIKVLSMLTKTFKKIMKQHNDIRKIHAKLSNLNVEIMKNITDFTKKTADIEEKYLFILGVAKKIKEFKSKMDLKEEYFKVKDREMSNNLVEFENQQKKFLMQQRQFYNIQKIMLAQNEKINLKQNLIAKTQSEISHRQYNFVRILKKAKQIYIDNKYSNPIKPLTSTLKPNSDFPPTESPNKITHTTTQDPYTTESIKINLFSIPAFDKLVNQDKLILKDKDEQSVDDLVYKYYFNNTFIDNLMKDKILSNFMITGENTEITRNTKNKRDEEIVENTLLLPVKKEEIKGFEGKLHREKRWIRHAQSKSKLKRKSRGKEHNENEDMKDEKPLKQKNQEVTTTIADINKVISNKIKEKNDPFVVMAKSFCNEIGHNKNDQALHWCVEKALRRLQHIDTIMPIAAQLPTGGNEVKSTVIPLTKESKKISTSNNIQSATYKVLGPSTLSSVVPITTSSIVTPGRPGPESTSNVYFPDNDELELNLKEFELKPDTEGTVYYDGSVHTSGIVSDDEGMSDIMPGLESNSRVEMDPLTFDLKAMRRDPLHRLAELQGLAYG
ncbi:unnamed protein product [Chilo suppressalis]|uniref:Uncharacterized protein n=1 Tax=Chilo suppressalis TaxID=168631 RepID=A0ABN8L9B3_CHISP|nr:unnamed protein product [Chilo suppressalis]